ncbi:glycosyltransferase family 4 protein [Phycicoccus flavus]|uniref:glycosyltransferase family 4 protein n=1 Tax=Phycicoccus flavus TaxID=2502783 RepID=UPI000FEBAA4D|nr:glycosyltransferase family 4 protein [Phycicoccus flavus]NHA67241.1 glycosyltransferase family 4 protein [Phycicoccus flavus]
MPSAPPQDRPLRVLFLNWRDSEHPEGGGSEVYAEQVCDGLAARGYSVTLLTARVPGRPTSLVRPSGVRHHRAGGRFSVYPAAAWAVLRRRVEPPDLVVETQNGVPYLAALWRRRATHVVLVHHVHREQWGVVFGPVLARVGWFVESVLAPRVNRRRPYVAVSDVTRDELVALGVAPERVRVVHNGAIPPPPHDVERSPTPLLLVLGRLVPHKRVEIALEVLARLAPDHPDLRLVVAGRGWWADHVAARVAELGLEERVELAGFVTDAERHRLYARAWASLVPSVKEGWGLVVVEAGMHGTPSVAFHGSGGTEDSIVDGVTGLLARADDVEDFTEAVRGLVEDPQRRDALGAAAERFAAGFTWDAAIIAWDEVLRATVAQRHPARRPRLGPGRPEPAQRWSP